MLLSPNRANVSCRALVFTKVLVQNACLEQATCIEGHVYSSIPDEKSYMME